MMFDLKRIIMIDKHVLLVQTKIVFRQQLNLKNVVDDTISKWWSFIIMSGIYCAFPCL